MPGPIELDTPRLRLRTWRDADRELFAAMNVDQRVLEFLPGPIEREASDASIDRWQEQFATQGWGIWAVERKDQECFIGFTGLTVPRRVLPFSPCVEVGWRLAAEHWGHGFATEAARAALQAGFERVGLDEIVSFTALGNRRSRAVMERIGLHDTGTVFGHPAVPQDHPMHAHCLYRITRAQWLRLPRHDGDPSS
jgi:RimJ/RimL family protein N-acetyltransferase